MALRETIIPTGRTVAVTSRVSSAQVLVETSPRFKLTLADVLARFQPPAIRKKALFERLFQERPLTRYNVREFFKDENEFDAVQYDVNRQFRKVYGCDAIVKRSLDSSTESGYRGFWIMDLNPELFKVPERAKLRPGEDFSLEDVHEPKILAVIDYLAEHPYSSLAEIKRVFGITGRFHLLGYANAQAKPFGTEHLVQRTSKAPFVYWLDKLLATQFGIEIKPVKPALETLFDMREIQLVLEVMQKRRASSAELQTAIGVSSSNLAGVIDRMERTCKELGIPKPFIADGGHTGRRYSLNPKFAKFFGLKSDTKSRLEDYFTSILIDTVKAIAENPLSTFSEIGVKLGISAVVVAQRVVVINSICERHKLPKLEKIPVVRGLLLVPLGFLITFGLPIIVPDRRKLVRGEIEEVVYAEMERDGSQTPIQIAEKLGLNAFQVVNSKSNIKRKMTRFASLLAQYLQSTANSEKLRSRLISHRIEKGRWPNDADLSNGAIDIAFAFGLERTTARIAKFLEDELTPDDRMRIVHHDFAIIQKWDFSKFEDPESVLRSFAGASIRGAELSALFVILNSFESDENAMAQANKINTKLGLSLEAIVGESGRTTSNFDSEA